MEFQTAVKGVRDFPTTSEMCYQYSQAVMPDAVSALFVRDYFSSRARSAVHDMVSYLKQSVMRRSIDQSSWMDDATKQSARSKVSTVTDLLGYPEMLGDKTFMDFLYNKVNFYFVLIIFLL